MSASRRPDSQPPRPLADSATPLGRLLEAARAAQAEVPPAARHRVWRALEERRAPRAAFGWVLGAAAAAAALALVVLRPWAGPARDAEGVAAAGTLELDGVRVALSPGARARLVREPGAARLLLEDGSAAVDVGPSAHGSFFLVAAGAVRLEASSALYSVSVSAGRVEVFAREGAVRVQAGGATQPVLAGGGWSSAGAPPVQVREEERALLGRLRAPPPLAPEPLPAPAPAPPAPAQAVAMPAPPPAEAPTPDRPRPRARLVAAAGEARHLRAQALEREGRFAEAEELYAALGAGEGPRAEAALYSLALLRLRVLAQPADALAALVEAQRRFPAGALALEAALTAVEVRLALGGGEPALREMDRFLLRFGDSERADEVRWLRASLLLERGACARARPDLEALAHDAERGDDAQFALASCARRSGDLARGREALEEYLRRFPAGRHRGEVEAALRGPARQHEETP